MIKKQKKFTSSLIIFSIILGQLLFPNLSQASETNLENSTENSEEIIENFDYTLNATRTFIRYSGIDRYETSVTSAKQAFPNGTKSVILASGEVYADALTASSLVSTFNAPIVLSTKNKLPNVVRDYIVKNNIDNLYIVGGPSTISEELQRELTTLSKNIFRISGVNRYATAIEVMDVVVSNNQVNDILLANGEIFADALAASSVAASRNIPIVLTNGEYLDNNTVNYLSTRNIDNIYLVGGSRSVISTVVKPLDFKDIDRLSGTTRVETSRAVAERFFQNSENVIITDGNNYPDALSASSVARSDNAGILLNTERPVHDRIVKYTKNGSIKNIIVIGGENSVSANANSFE